MRKGRTGNEQRNITLGGWTGASPTGVKDAKKANSERGPSYQKKGGKYWWPTKEEQGKHRGVGDLRKKGAESIVVRASSVWGETKSVHFLTG